MDSIFCDRNNIGSIFALEFERSPLSAVGDEVTFCARRSIFGAFHFDDKRMNFWILSVVRDEINDSRRVGLDKNLLFEGPCFHAVIILEVILLMGGFDMPCENHAGLLNHQ